jgi:acetyl-CoA acyltransferase
MTMAQAFIVDYLRSPFALARKGDLAGVRPDDLAAGVVSALMGPASTQSSSRT